MSLADDPRWQAMLRAGALAPVVFPAPDAWPHGPRPSGEKSLTIGDDSLSERYCTLAGHRFVCAALTLPIKGAREGLGVQAWGSVSEATWAALIAARTGGTPFEGGFAWLANALPGFGAEPIGMNLLPGRPGALPRLFAQSGPLQAAQQTGLDLDALAALLAAVGRDIQGPLSLP